MCLLEYALFCFINNVIYQLLVETIIGGNNYWLHVPGLTITSDIRHSPEIYSNFWTVGHMTGIHVHYASMKLILRIASYIRITKALLLIKLFCSSEVAMKPYCK